MSIKQELVSFVSQIDTVGAGYKSWGDVSIQRIAVRDGSSIFDSQIDNPSSKFNTESSRNIEEDRIIASIFSKRKNINPSGICLYSE